MSEKKVGKRLLTWVLVLVMTLSLLPLNVLADVIPETDNTPGKVTATKSCTKEPDSNGNYTITLTVKGNPVSSTDTMTTPRECGCCSGGGQFRLDGNQRGNALQHTKR